MNAEEVELLSDSKYRNYVAAVDKALKNFEYSSEWADLISALGKLNKVRTQKPHNWAFSTFFFPPSVPEKEKIAFPGFHLVKS